MPDDNQSDMVAEDTPLVPSYSQASGDSKLHHDLIWAYVASGAKIASAAFVAGLLFRRAGAAEFAMFALIRGTIGVLNYTSLGLAPAMVRLLAEALAQSHPDSVLPTELQAEAIPHRPRPAGLSERSVYANGVSVAALSLALGLVLTLLYSHWFDHLHRVPPGIPDVALVVVWIGLGTLMRLFSDSSGAVLQTRGRIALDNKLLASAEVVWVISLLICGAKAIAHREPTLLVMAAFGYAIAGCYLAFVRAFVVSRLVQSPWPPAQSLVKWDVIGRLAAFGVLVLFAQLADYLYAPTDYILINRLLDPNLVATYAPAVQIDAGLLMLVSGLAAVLLPRAAIAHTTGSTQAVVHYYIRGTLASAAMLIIAAAGVYAISPWLFHVWFGAAPPNTRAILPLVLIHTIVGGSSAVGRSILLAMGKVSAFTVSTLTAGAINVAASYCFVHYLHLGLEGIIFGTIIAVIGRCALWMPWYVVRTLRKELAASA